MNERRRAAAHVFVDDLAHPVPHPDDVHHLQRVLRLRDGETVSASDGRGGWRSCVWSSGTLAPVGGMHAEPRVRSLAVAFALCKGDKPEVIVQKLTELGVDTVVPFVSERSVVKWDAEKSVRNVERWRKVAHEAAMQSRQVYLPTITDVVPSIDDLVNRSSFEWTVAEPGGGVVAATVSAIAVGPEGGFTDDELARFVVRVGLPGGVLRAETAAVVAGALLVAAR
ncbi:MAG: RsmE family RNA methyltransferase [Acidimicrobiia bacterium]